MTICYKCGADIEGAKHCPFCGTRLEDEDEIELKRLLKEAEQVNEFNKLKQLSIDAYNNKEYAKSLEYADKALDIGIGTDGELSFARGKSLFYLNRFYDAANCFLEYIKEYKESFFRYSNISEAYEWRAASLWQLGDGFNSIKNYYNALDYVEDQPCSNQEKMDLRLRIEESKRNVINSSKNIGVSNPRLGNIDLEVYDKLEQLDPDINKTVQNLYDCIDSLKPDGYEFNSLLLKDNKIYVEFLKANTKIEKYFDGSPNF